MELIVISPDLPEYLAQTIQEKSLNYSMYSDSKTELINAFGLAYRMDDEIFNQYREMKQIDIERNSGQNHHNLPVPAVYVVDNTKKIAFSYANTDHKIRLDKAVLLDEVEKLLLEM